MIIFITGPRNSGKTLFLSSLAHLLKKEGRDAGGIISPARITRGKKDIYCCSSIVSGRTERLLRLGIGGPKTYAGGFGFAARVMAAARRRRIFIIDEMGPIEMRGEGFFRQAKRRMTHNCGHTIISVRPDLLRAMADKLGVRPDRTISLSSPDRLDHQLKECLAWLS